MGLQTLENMLLSRELNFPKQQEETAVNYAIWLYEATFGSANITDKVREQFEQSLMRLTLPQKLTILYYFLATAERYFNADTANTSKEKGEYYLLIGRYFGRNFIQVATPKSYSKSAIRVGTTSVEVS